MRPAVLLMLLVLGLPAGAKPGIEILTRQKDVIWSFDFLPDGRILFTERAGKLRLLTLPAAGGRPAAVIEVAGAPEVHVERQAGLFDVRVLTGSTDDAATVFLSYARKLPGGSATALGSGALSVATSPPRLESFREIHAAAPPVGTAIHYGGRIEFDGAGHLFLTVGDRNERALVQKRSASPGKIVRMKLDGSDPEVWSLGHRNPQGLVIDPDTGELWSTEMGPRGGDELNRIERGRNYGWPIITHGREYWGAMIGPSSGAGFEQPVVHWTPSISPSGLVRYSGTRYPEWQGSFLIACLGSEQIRRVRIGAHGQTIEQQALFEGLGLRFRTIRQGPDGWLYVSTDDGKLARIVSSGAG